MLFYLFRRISSALCRNNLYSYLLSVSMIKNRISSIYSLWKHFYLKKELPSSAHQPLHMFKEMMPVLIAFF